MNVTITPYDVKDEENINHLLFLCYGTDEDSQAYFKRGWKSSLNMGTFLAKNNSELIGMVAAWKTRFHPKSLYFSLVVHPFYRGENIEFELLKSIEKLSINLPLQTSIWETNFSLKTFLHNYDFTEIRRTYMPTLYLSTIHDLNEALIDNFHSNDMIVTSLREVLNDQDMQKKLILLVKETYEKTHEVNPPQANLKEWEKAVFDEDTLLNGSYIFTENDDILGFALLHIGENPDSLEFGWRGVKDKKNMKWISLLTALQIKYAKKSGYKYVLGEMDTTDPYSLEVLKTFPFSPSPTWITYKKDR
ncbi:GNAT family N-acetyltransferase [Heyndrickxia camelliae]|uniref:GNAT family acetyltransferase n=1 Tax=Heyndrickxia camelliae TaxID=1707093 RepID=A0A2N3LDQ6_9BACI|nr:GNAT family N-acetyltransferase [Heyndrickxia camelliae]PKR82736.1 GNAT family acetyltransferase [Heyndrickxia camelliae]